ncbi:TonB-dependent siderophore receptor [Altericroceibacterium endophyticum]|uniref:TonB-dependent siderophore receptor n=1 Tax=Altericroceibacterium endophyticum TaxID=1808508 RepID=A0A6I4T736_9SPHN|nr:TonB-dependent siderophore receptor [Altericroceibacterium endophyticum]
MSRHEDRNTIRDVAEIIVTGVQEGQVTEDFGSYTTRSTGAALGLPLRPREIPQAVTVITSQIMEDQSLTNLDSVLQSAPGVTRNYIDSERVRYSSRGFGVDNIMYDGVVSSLDNGIGFIDTALYDRVEIVRGATGLLTGSGNPSASINLIRKRPKNAFAIGASALAGSWENYRGSLDLSAPLTGSGKIRARVIGVYQDQESYLDFYQPNKAIGYGVVEADLTDHTILTAGVEYQDSQPEGSSWGAAPLFYSDGSLTTDLRRSANLSPPWTYFDVESLTAFLNLSHDFANGWKFKSALTHSKLDSDAELFALTGVDPTNPRRNIGFYPDRQTGFSSVPVMAAGTKFSSKTKQDTVDLQTNGPIELFGREHQLIVGATLSWMKRNSPGSRLATNLYFPFSTTPAPSLDQVDEIPRLDFENNSLPWSKESQVKTRKYGLYAAARLSPTEDLKVILGGRFNRYELDEDEVGSDSLRYRQNRFTPYAGTTYDITKNFTLFASYTEIFKPQTDRRDRNGNILEPTKGNSREVGIKGEFFRGDLNLSLTLFDTRLDKLAQEDVGFFDPNNPLSSAYIAVDGTKTRGFELEAAGEILPNWNVSGGFTWLKSEAPDGERLNAQEPRRTLKFFTSYRLPGALDGLTIGGGIHWQSNIEFRGINRPDGAGGILKDQTVVQGSYALVNALARYAFNESLSASVNVNNLFDKRYWMRAGFYDTAAVGAPRNAMFTIRLRY